MARDRASIRIDMWADSDWRALSLGAQHLYMLLLSHPTLSYAGVADWRAGRLAAMTAGRSQEAVHAVGLELQEAHFILIDEDTEEVLVRSFVKHDGLLKQPKLAVSMANAYAAVASARLREVIAFEVQKLHKRDPSLSAWAAKQVQTILVAKATGIASFIPTFTPALTPPLTPSGGQELAEPTTTATTTATSTEVDKPTTAKAAERATRIPEPFIVTAEMRSWAGGKYPTVDVDEATESFVDYWRGRAGAGGRKLDWDATWRNSIRMTAGRQKPGAGKPTPEQRARQTMALAMDIDMKEIE